MIEIPTSERRPAGDRRGGQHRRTSLPILPLKDSVPFPETLTPLAVGQERSIKLVNDVLERQPDARDGRLARRARSRTRARRPLRRGRGRHRGAHDQGARRHAADPGARLPAGAARRVRPERALPRPPRSTELPDEIEPSPELEALFRNVQTTFSRIIEEVPYLPEELQIAVANLEDPAELAHMIAGALRIKTEERQELLEELDVAKRLRRLSELLARELELISIGTQDPVAGRVRDRQGPARVLPAPAAQGDPGGAGRGRRDRRPRPHELREQIEAAELPEHALKQAERELQRFERLPPQSAEHGVIRSYLEWLADAALVEVHRRPPRPQGGAPGARPRPLRHREGQGPHPRVPGGAQAQARRAQLDPLLRRPARAWARPRSASRSPPPWAASSSASRSAACATSPRSAATAAPTSARCPARSSARCATPGPTTRC